MEMNLTEADAIRFVELWVASKKAPRKVKLELDHAPHYMGEDNPLIPWRGQLTISVDFLFTHSCISPPSISSILAQLEKVNDHA